MKQSLNFDSKPVYQALDWYEQQYKTVPDAMDFEKEFCCKLSNNVITFNSIRDKTYFILRWG